MKKVSTVKSPARDSPMMARSSVTRYRRWTSGSSSSWMNARKAVEPPEMGAASRSEATEVGPVRSRRRTVFSIPTTRRGRSSPARMALSTVMWRVSFSFEDSSVNV
jgi:hypothetical protein